MADSNEGSASRYDLLFRGELLPDAVLATVQAELAAVLKLDDARLQQLFSGANVMVRRAADRDTAARFQSVFRQAGARLRVTPVVSADAEPAASAHVAQAPAAATQAVAAAAVEPAAAPPKMSLAARLAAQESAAGAGAAPSSSIEFASAPPSASRTGPAAAVAAGQTRFDPPGSLVAGARPSGGTLQVRDVPAALRRSANVRVPDFELAPVGADLIEEDEREIAPSARIETDHIGLAAPGGLIPNLADSTREVPAVHVPDLDVAPVGAVLGEQTEFVELPLDLSAYSLAPVGARLGLEQRQAALALDLSHLQLEPVPRA